MSICFASSSLDNTITFSTPLVQQNISTLCTFCTLYPFSTNSAASRACVATLQLTYTTRFGAACAIASITAGSTPLRGGSITITSGRKPSATSFGSSTSAAPQRKFTFPIPLRTAFSFAFSIACGTISMPSASRQWRAIISVIVPAPQYTSHRRSSPVSSAKSSAVWYSTSVCAGLT